MQQKRLFIHLGLHKTGTTSLQASIFPNIEDIAYLGRAAEGGFANDVFYDAIMKFCCEPSPKRVPALRAKCLEIWMYKPVQDYLLSDEWLSSDYDGFFFGKGASWQEKISRLMTLQDELDIYFFFTERNLVEHVLSLYDEFQRVEYGRKWQSCLKFAAESNEVLSLLFLREKLYNDVNEKNLLTLSFDDLKSNPEKFLGRISAFMDKDLCGLNIAHENKSEQHTLTLKSPLLLSSRRIVDQCVRFAPMQFRQSLRIIAKKIGLKLLSRTINREALGYEQVKMIEQALWRRAADRNKL